MRGVRPYLLLAAFCGLLFFWRLGAIPLMGLDEGYYAECSREMIAAGNYIVPTCNGAPFYDKPVLCYWLQAAGIRAFGVNSFAARLPSAIECLLLVAFTAYLADRLYGRRAGVMSGFVLAGSLITVGLARMAIMDAAFALAITVSLGCFLMTYTKRAPRSMYLAFWAAMGVAAMIKGPAGVVLILAAVLCFLAIRRDLRAAASAMPVAGAALCLLIALPWYLIVQSRTGGAFLKEFIIHQNFQRALGMDFQHNQPWFFYILVYLVGFFPWSVFLPAAIAESRKQEIEKTTDTPSARVSGFESSGAERKSRNTSQFLIAWICMIFIIYSLLKSKMPAYIYPIWPPSAVLVGMLWSRAVDRGITSAIRKSALATTLLACVITVGVCIAESRLRDPIPGLSAAVIPMGVALIVGCVACYVLLLARQALPAFAALAVGMGILAAIAASQGLPIAARPNAIPAASVGAAISRTRLPAFAYDLSPPQPGIGFYAGRPVKSLETPADLEAALNSQSECLVVVQVDKTRGVPAGGALEAAKGPYVLLHFTQCERRHPSLGK